MALQAESGFQSEHLPSCRLQRPFPSFRNLLGLILLLRAAGLGGGPSAFTCGIALLCFAAALDPYMNGEPQSPPTKMPVALMDLLAERSAAAWPARCFCRALGRARSQALRPKRARWSKSSHWAAPRVRQDARLYFWLRWAINVASVVCCDMGTGTRPAHQLKEALLLALWRRERVGKGAMVDVSLFAAAVLALCFRHLPACAYTRLRPAHTCTCTHVTRTALYNARDAFRHSWAQGCLLCRIGLRACTLFPGLATDLRLTWHSSCTAGA